MNWFIFYSEKPNYLSIMFGRLSKKYVEFIAGNNKKSFGEKFSPEWCNSTTSSIGWNIISFSGKKYFEDQLYSIASFYRNIGRPNSWTVFTDGSYTEKQLDQFKSIAGIKIKQVDKSASSLGFDALMKYPTLQKIEILRDIVKPDITTLFSDSDILFFPSLREFIPALQKSNWYLVDEGNGYFDKDYIQNHIAIINPLNLGLLILNESINWQFVTNYLLTRIKQGRLEYWSDQTACHIMMGNNSRFMPLDKAYFVVGGNDSFKIRHAVNYNKIALRHFVGPVRHKMWQTDWKKVLNLPSYN